MQYSKVDMKILFSRALQVGNKVDQNSNFQSNYCKELLTRHCHNEKEVVKSLKKHTQGQKRPSGLRQSLHYIKCSHVSEAQEYMHSISLRI